MDRRAFSMLVAGLPFAASAPGDAERPRSQETGETPFANVSTFTHVGKEEQPFLTTPEATLADQDGSGYLDHMWFGGAFSKFTDLRIRIYVDHEVKPSIDMLLGMGVGVGFGDPAAPWGTRFGGITGAPSGIFLNYPIPFSKNVRVTAELPEGVQRDTVFWWIVRGITNLPLRIADLQIPSSARLRLHRLDDQHVAPLQEFELCHIAGDGLLFQVTMAAQSSNFEFMEGQMRAYIGAHQELQFLSSGLEDYFLGTYYFNRGLYHLPQAGLTHKDEANHSFSAYRFHDIDPVFFSNGLRLTCRCGEKRGEKVFGTTGHPQPTTYTTYVWVYEW